MNDGNGEDGDESEDGNLLPSLRHLVVQDISSKFNMETDELNQSWELVHSILESRKNSDVPITALTLSGREKFADGEGSDELVEADKRGIERAGECVEIVMDKRGRSEQALGGGEGRVLDLYRF